jgi:hypothetical protein
MYAFAALALLGAWCLNDRVYHAANGVPYLLLAAAMLSVAMHVLRRSEPA